MASINNWLAFSLSPQELPSSQPHPDRLISGVDGASATDCFGLSIDSASEPPLAIPTLRPDLPFGILEAFNRTSHQNHGWNMKGLDSMLVGSSSNQTAHMEEDEPKLEDFLGSHSSSGEYVFSDYKEMGNVGNSHSSSIGLSMIKTWLRNQPPPVPGPTADGKLVVGGSNAGQSSSQSLSLSMSMASQSSSALPTMAGGAADSSTSPEKSGGALDAQSGAIEAVTRKSIDTFGQRTSIYRGVTRHRWTGRYEAHLWDNSCRREGQSRKGRQVYLGGYDKEEKAARSYDLAALKYWGPTTTTNFPISNYEKELEEMKHMTRQEYVASLRRKSSGFSRGASIYRGVTRHHQHGRWQARIGRVAGNKDLYLGTFSTQEEAAEAYDIAAIKFRGLNAVTNFDMSRYDVKSILESSTLPIGGAAKRLKEAADLSDSNRQTAMHALPYHDTVGTGSAAYGWPTVAFPTPQPLSVQYPYPHQRGWCKQEQDAGVPSHTMQDVHQLHLGSGVNTHDFFQPSMAFNNNFLSLPDSGGGCGAAGSMEQAAGSDSVGYQNGYVLPMSNGHGSGACFGVDQEGLMGAYAYLGNPQLAVGVVKATAGHEQSGGFSGWGQAAVPSQVGAPLFSVWNDS